MDKYTKASIVFTKFSRHNVALKRFLPIRPSEMSALNIITRCGCDITPMVIAERLGVSKPMTAAHIQSLEEKGYIYKETSPDDKRSFYVRPTEAGRALTDEFEAKQRETMMELESKLGSDKFEELICLLDMTQRILHEMNDGT